jgi:hypothetical protein
MQRKKSQHIKILKESFENIIISKKELDEHLENSTRHKTKAIIVLNTRETRITLKLSMEMVSQLLFEALFLTKLTLKHAKGFWQPKGTPEGGNGHEK